MKEPVGHKLNVGEWFESQTKRMHAGERQSTGDETLRFYPAGTKMYFQHKNRRYYCEVMGCIEERTGWHYGVWPDHPVGHQIDKRPQWWQFTYVVKVLEN